MLRSSLILLVMSAVSAQAATIAQNVQAHLQTIENFATVEKSTGRISAAHLAKMRERLDAVQEIYNHKRTELKSVQDSSRIVKAYSAVNGRPSDEIEAKLGAIAKAINVNTKNGEAQKSEIVKAVNEAQDYISANDNL